MSATTRLAVTGATGRIGGRVARRLAEAGVAQRLVVRRPDAAPSLAGATVARAGYGEAAALRTAFEGIETLFMVSASEAADRVEQHRSVIDAAAASGVQHVVYLSFVGAASDAVFLLARDHWATEQHLHDSGMSWTSLRDNLYMEDLVRLAGEDGVIRGPAGEGRLAAVAQDDIADAALAVLRGPADHAGRTYDLTGPQAISLAEAASTITHVTGRVVTYIEETIEQAHASRATYDAPQWMIDAWISTYTAIAAGEMAEVSDAVQRLTGRPPMALDDLLRRG